MSEEKKENLKNELTEEQTDQVSGGSDAPKPDVPLFEHAGGSIDYFESLLK